MSVLHVHGGGGHVRESSQILGSIVAQNVVVKCLNSCIDRSIPPSGRWIRITGCRTNIKIVRYRLAILKQYGDELVHGQNSGKIHRRTESNTRPFMWTYLISNDVVNVANRNSCVCRADWLGQNLFAESCGFQAGGWVVVVRVDDVSRTVTDIGGRGAGAAFGRFFIHLTPETRYWTTDVLLDEQKVVDNITLTSPK